MAHLPLPRVRVWGSDYMYEGDIVAVFTKKRGDVRVVVEDDNGRLFIHNCEQLKRDPVDLLQWQVNKKMPAHEKDHPSHNTRFSDSSLYDVVCMLCGATDARNDVRLRYPCPCAPKETVADGKEG